MKKLALILIPFALLMADDKKIPEGAQQVEPYLYRYTDAQGKNWFYRESPFGLMKSEGKAAVDNNSGVEQKDLGDRVEFRRKTPFGEQRWVRMKTELNDVKKTTEKQ